MKRSRSSRYRGKYHLPLPTGRYTVGCVDIITESKNGVFFRLFYPAQQTGDKVHYLEWVKWIPDKHYIRGYAMYMGIHHEFLKLVHSLFIGDVYIPAVWQANISQDEPSFPVIIFSPGLTTWRNAYSTICLELASHGFVVASLEHRDRSSCATYYLKERRMSTRGPHPGAYLKNLDDDLNSFSVHEWLDVINQCWEPTPTAQSICPSTCSKEWLYYQTPRKSNEAFFRKNQLIKRAKECIQVLDILDTINNGTFVPCILQSGFRIDSFKGHFNLGKAALIGHSFGGATTILTLAIESRFRVGIALDPWMYPFLNDQSSFSLLQQPLLVINTSSFQDKSALDVMKMLRRTDVERLFLTIRNSRHRDQSDVPFVGCFLCTAIIGASLIGDKFKSTDISAQLMLQFLQKHLSIAYTADWKSELYMHNSKVKNSF